MCVKFLFIFQAVALELILGGDSSCFHPEKGIHITVQTPSEPSDGKYPLGTLLTYICDPGYQLFGNSTRECSENGLWSGAEPYCGFRAEAAQMFFKYKIDDNFYDFKGNVPYCLDIKDKHQLTWFHFLKKPYLVNRIEMAINLNNGVDIHEIKLETSTNYDTTKLVHKNISVLGITQETRKGHMYLIYQFAIDESEAIGIAAIYIRRKPGQILNLCEISLFTSEDVPENRCGPESHKYFSFENRCYVLLKNNNNQLEAERNCRDHDPSAVLALYNNGAFKYIRNKIYDVKDYQNVEYWIQDRNADNSCSTINFSGAVYKYQRDCNNMFRILCSHDVSRCGSPDQNRITSMQVIDNKYANYSCPRNFKLDGESERHCLKGRWTNSSPTCKPFPAPQGVAHLVSGDAQTIILTSIITYMILLS